MDPNQNNAKQQIVDRLKDANNVLVTVSANPSVDQLSACIGLTLLLNKLGKHGTAVFSGKPPSTIEFLQPEKTIEKNTDSLRDFIIALDKSKADKLRYKVEEKTVKIFITPYRSSLSQADFEFSQGDFNIDAIIALGVHQREELDQAITGQARILHDATVISINNTSEGSLGSINWNDSDASSLCEMLVFLGDALKSDFLDPQLATALLTGIVAETDRFSNDKTTPRTMTTSGKLMTAGANQQLIATKLDEPQPEAAPTIAEELPEAVPLNEPTEPAEPTQEQQLPEVAPETPEEPSPEEEGTLEIDRKSEETLPDSTDTQDSDELEESEEQRLKQIHIDEQGTVRPAEEVEAELATQKQVEDLDELSTQTPAEAQEARFIVDPPVMGGAANANDSSDPLVNDDGALDPTAADTSGIPLLTHDSSTATTSDEPDLPELPSAANEPPQPPPPLTSLFPDNTAPEAPSPTLEELEETVHSPHLQVADDQAKDKTVPDETPEPSGIDTARDAVYDAMNGSTDGGHLEPLQAFNNSDLGVGGQTPEPPAVTPLPGVDGPLPPVNFPPNLVPPVQLGSASDDNSKDDNTSDDEPPAPPVPPPMMPPLPPLGAQDNSFPSNSNPFTLPPAS